VGAQDRANLIHGGSVILLFFQLVIMTWSAHFHNLPASASSALHFDLNFIVMPE